MVQSSVLNQDKCMRKATRNGIEPPFSARQKAFLCMVGPSWSCDFHFSFYIRLNFSMACCFTHFNKVDFERSNRKSLKPLVRWGSTLCWKGNYLALWVTESVLKSLASHCYILSALKTQISGLAK
jgi:hypothetical protein